MIRFNLVGLLVISLGAWLSLMMAPNWSLRNWSDYMALRDSVPILYQAVGITLFCGSAFVLFISPHGRLGFKDITLAPHILFLTFCIFTLATATFSISLLDSTLFSGMHIAVYCSMLLFWRYPEMVRKYLPALGLSLFVYLFLMAAWLGVRGRTFGFAPPNDLAKFAMVGAVMMSLGGGRALWAGLVLSVVIAVLTESRGTLVALGLFYSGRFVLDRLTNKRIILLSFMIACVTLFVLVDVVLNRENSVTSAAVERVLLLQDETRGIDSGLTGRTGRWDIGLLVWQGSPIFGYGVRTREAFSMESPSPAFNAHSGYINMLMDVGVLGSSLLMLSLIFNLRQRLTAIRKVGDDRSAVVINATSISLTISALFLWVLEPIYINIGSPFSILTLLLLAAPMYPASSMAPEDGCQSLRT